MFTARGRNSAGSIFIQQTAYKFQENDIAIIRVLEYNDIANDGGAIMDFMSAREAADKWGISQRRVAVLCSEKRIENAAMVGNMWIIPTTADKPADARSVRYEQCDNNKVKPFL